MESKDRVVQEALGIAGDPSIEKLAEAAAEQEKAAQEEPSRLIYVHTLSRPFQWEGKTYEKLTFQWDTLTGADHLEIEHELLMQGMTLVVPAYTGDYLCGMAVRACREWGEKGGHAMYKAAMKALPLRDFTAVCNEARHFLLRSESQPEMEDSGSGDSV